MNAQEQEHILDEIISCMAIAQENPELQRIQTRHRLHLVDFWDIPPGSKVLEIGCGQGDTTAVLAHRVGRDGLVYGIDIAPLDYGSPVTVGDSAKFLLQSKLGFQTRMEYGVNLLAPETDFPAGSFSHVVLSHASWYLNSNEELLQIFTKIHKWGAKLCFAEWDTQIRNMHQFPHLLSVLIQAKYECFKESSSANVRTLFTPQDIRDAAAAAGWIIRSEQTIAANDLQDGQWETETVLRDYGRELDELEHLPDKLKMLIRSEVHLLEQSIRGLDHLESMSAYAMTAEGVQV
ncbi:class I SAM-dependent methyltransferase [Paenibacillus dauci]|uniref:class I SAM-dependent methyltransferase n=1 Tax=Paenibacillus dauci TaxID=1567106 RepID=UPI000619255C|nr:methyltransferase domain-containing protein [Paenibacillus dauci]